MYVLLSASGGPLLGPNFATRAKRKERGLSVYSRHLQTVHTNDARSSAKKLDVSVYFTNEVNIYEGDRSCLTLKPCRRIRSKPYVTCTRTSTFTPTRSIHSKRSCSTSSQPTSASLGAPCR